MRYIFLEKIGLIFSNISWLFVRYIFLEKIGLIFSNISWLFVRYICKWSKKQLFIESDSDDDNLVVEPDSDDDNLVEC